MTTDVNDEDFFKLEDFDRMDICYLAFVNFDMENDFKALSKN